MKKPVATMPTVLIASFRITFRIEYDKYSLSRVRAQPHDSTLIAATQSSM
jgi:hypothetical protein